MRAHLLRGVLRSLDLELDADRGLVVPPAGQERLAYADGAATEKFLGHGAVAHGVTTAEVADRAQALRDDHDRVGVVLVLRLGDEERGEGDVLPAPEGIATDLAEEILVVGRADDADVPVAEELDARRDGVPCLAWLMVGLEGLEPSTSRL